MSGPLVARASPVNARALDMRLYNMQQQIAALMAATGVTIPAEPAPPAVQPVPVTEPVPEPVPAYRQRTVLLD